MERPGVTVGAIVQARMGSTRLPGKVLRPIVGKSLLAHVLGRLATLDFPVRIVVATSDLPQDDPIAEHAAARGVAVFRGSELDVLDRYYRCAVEYGFDHVVRLTGDNPFTDVDELRRMIELHLTEGNDYTHSFGVLPLGAGAEIFTFEALERSAKAGDDPRHREHVNEYILDHLDAFRVGVLQVEAAKSRPDVRLTVDTEEDYRRACAIAGHDPGRWIGTQEAIRLCSASA
jgi:spore coat polysaccharide biosynthesis protein SpsF